MSRTARNLATMAASLVLLAGCCTNVTTDPRKGGLAGGVCGQTTGAYDLRIATLQSRANQLDAANSQLSSRLSANRSKAANLYKTTSRKRAQLAQAKRDLNELRTLAARKNQAGREVEQLMADARSRERNIMAFEQGMKTARNERIRDQAYRNAKQVPVEDLLRRIRRLRASLE